jgi:hypothetical protein
MVAFLSCPVFAATTASLHKAHHSRRHRFHWSLLWNPLFRPSHESLILQNAEVDRMELPRI